MEPTIDESISNSLTNNGTEEKAKEDRRFMLYHDYFETPFGVTGVIFDEARRLVFIALPSTKENIFAAIMKKCPPETYKLVRKRYFGREAFLSYFHGESDAITKLPINMDFFAPSEFQKMVWGSCALVPFGVKVTYGDIGQMIGSRAYRAIGGALSRNPLPIIIPCHRVVGKQSLGGFSADGGVNLKAKMLTLEAQI